MTPEPQWGCIHRPDPDQVAEPSKHDSTGLARWTQNPSRSACTGAVPGGVGCQGGHGPWSRVPSLLLAEPFTVGSSKDTHTRG